jgi:hypothetical protein
MPPNFLTQHALAITFGSEPASSRMGMSACTSDSPMCSRGKLASSTIKTSSDERLASSAPRVEPAGPPPAMTTS